VARHNDHRLLVILVPSNPLIQAHDVTPRKLALVDHDQVPSFYERPLQIPVHVAADLAHPRVTTTGMHAGTNPA